MLVPIERTKFNNNFLQRKEIEEEEIYLVTELIWRPFFYPSRAEDRLKKEMVLSRCVTVLQKLPPPSLQKNMALNGSWRERDPREGRKEIGHEGLCILLSWTVKLVSTRPGTNQIEERYGEKEGFRGTIERREIVGYTACYVYYMFCGDSWSLHPLSSRFLGNGKERRMEDKAVATCKMPGMGGFDEGERDVSWCNSIRKIDKWRGEVRDRRRETK